ncbi:hypothetical protein KDN24_11925 [Bacillus sp. Bva_UNVM-123]|uniref:hypothetical protein n=1 Tax=Bacillus sp. Bva_UNVM-123 TaxID=2829798 RepID=UPI00391FAC62
MWWKSSDREQKKINIKPSQEQIDNWIKKYVPDKDYYFLEEKDIFSFKSYLEKNKRNPDHYFDRDNFINYCYYNAHLYFGIKALN